MTSAGGGEREKGERGASECVWDSEERKEPAVSEKPVSLGSRPDTNFLLTSPFQAETVSPEGRTLLLSVLLFWNIRSAGSLIKNKTLADGPSVVRLSGRALLVRKNPGCVSKARRRRGRVTALREQRGAASGARPQRSEPGRGVRGGQRRDGSGEPRTAGRKCRHVSTEDTEQVSASLSRRTVSQVCDWLISHCNRDTRGSRLQDRPH